MPPDIEIARKAKMLPIEEIAAKLGIAEADLEHYGKVKAKVDLDLFHRRKEGPRGKLVLVTAIKPTPAGRRQDHDEHRPVRRPEPDRQEERSCACASRSRALLRHEGRGGRRRLRPGRPHGGHQPPFHRRLPRHRAGPQPAGRDARQPHPPRQRAGHRSAAGRLESGGRHERPRPARARDRPGGPEQLDAPRDRASTSPSPPR